MTLVQLQYFNNITKAAAELHITQPSISNAIKDLEEEFGVNLFYRLSKGLSLTEEGHYFLEKANQILDCCDALVQQMCDMGNKKKDINIGVPPMIGTILFPYMFQSFRELYPDIKLSLLEYGSVHTCELVADGTLDAAIVSMNSADHSNFESVNILDTETLFCVSTTHPLAKCPAVDFDMIKDEPFVLFKEDSYQTASIKKLFKNQSITPNVILYSSQLHTIKELIVNNVACSVLYKGIVNNNDDIVAIPFKNPIMTKIKLIWNKNKHLYSDVTKFIEFTKSYHHR